MIEPEMAFSDLWNTMDNAESYVKYVVKYVMNVCKTDLDFFNSYVDKELLNRLVKLVDQPFQKVRNDDHDNDDDFDDNYGHDDNDDDGHDYDDDDGHDYDDDVDDDDDDDDDDDVNVEMMVKCRNNIYLQVMIMLTFNYVPFKFAYLSCRLHIKTLSFCYKKKSLKINPSGAILM